MPLVGVAIAILFGLSDAIAVGLVITACAAGSTYSAKLVEVAGGDIRTGLSLMFLLAIVTAIVLGPVAAAMIGLLGSATGAHGHPRSRCPSWSAWCCSRCCRCSG